ncbi:MAG: hypothetical protein KY468_12040, partial [Armatimonadetes bacterium]|nr:hypothetical protein [Armatimonadota bacterium]
MDEALLLCFANVITAHTGLVFPEHGRKTLNKVLSHRMRALRLSTPQEYLELLNHKGAAGESEWEELTLSLTTGESYFFRDQGQFGLLRERLLPELLRENRETRSLRVWSAGSSTGEEAYSLAILLHELLPKAEEWNVLILGTDLNSEAVQKARHAVYRSWSFRKVDPAIRSRYFRERQDEWELDAKIRSKVIFQTANLLKDEYPGFASPLHDMDLILCRNVFIYFDRESTAVVLKKLTATLREGGYLLTAHAELQGQDMSGLETVIYPESIVYRRRTGDSAPILVTPVAPDETSNTGTRDSVSAPFPSLEKTFFPPKARQSEVKAALNTGTALPQETGLAAAQSLLEQARYEDALGKALEILAGSPRSIPALILSAKACANLGQIEEAGGYCRQAIEADPLGVMPYYLLAHLAEESGDFEEVERLLLKVLYLSPSFIKAYLVLAAFYEREKDIARAGKMRALALEKLGALSPDASIESCDGLTAKQLMLQLHS